MARTTYAHPADVLRKFDPTLLRDGRLEQNDFIGSDDDEELVRARIEGVEDDFEDLTRNPYRERRVGVPDERRTYEAHDADFRRYQGGVRVWLENYPAVPFDREAGDRLLIRTGRNNWRDITDRENSMWEARWPDGELTIYAARYAGAWRNAALRDNIRVCYRHGALGGSRDRGGQTELAEPLTQGDTSVSVKDIARLPNQGLLLVGGDEYVKFSRPDYESDSLESVSRGLRGTTETDHDADAEVHYCPVSIREAIAARTAVELLEYDDWVDQLVEATNGFAKNQKVDEWNSEWEQILNKHSGARLL